ncbi:MAG: DEAD/DEAH box helicase [Bacteroidota bacterium]
MKFEDLKLSKSLLEGLKALNFEEPTPIQEQTIPHILKGRDIIGAAQTGTGKTGAFVIPLIQKLINDQGEGIKALILSPTRELANQIDEQIFAIGYHANISSATVIGGSDFSEQARAIRAGVPILVATPGRLIDQMKVMNPDFSNLKYLILDEADRMLDMGFFPDVKKIITQLPKERQTLLFSATMPDEVVKLSDQFMNDPVKVEIEIEKPPNKVEQRIYKVSKNDKLDLVEQLLDDEDWESVIIFTRTKRGTDQLYRRLRKRGISAVHMHGDKDQSEREAALLKFKNGEYPVMVATDVLSRGIDIDNVSIIINFDVPNSPDDYIHRIGRTGRYDKTGMAITLVSRSENKPFHAIKKVVGDQLSYQDAKIAKKGKQSSSSKRTKRSSNKKKKESDQGNQRDKRKQKRRDGAKKSNERKQERKNRKSKKENKNRDGKYKQRKQSKRQQKKKPSSRSKQQKQEKKKQPPPQKKQNKRSEKKRKNRRENRQKGRSKKTPSVKRRQRQKIERRVQSEHPREDLPVIEKAVQRNKRARKPAKGVWGIIKSLLPKVGKK